MNDIPMTFSVAAGGIIAAFFVISTLYGIRFCQQGRWRLGLCILVWSVGYGGLIVSASV
jgi:hypothetical protein